MNTERDLLLFKLFENGVIDRLEFEVLWDHADDVQDVMDFLKGCEETTTNLMGV